jgi:DNA-binding transcriptional LysR family regulator
MSLLAIFLAAFLAVLNETGMKNIDYQLRQFVKVASYKSLSEAAIALNVTQSALSKQLREIELAVGHRVFRRHGRGIELTKQGDALWRAVQAAYKLVDATIGQIRSAHSRAPGKTLRVATLHGRSQFVVNELVVAVLGKRPEIDLTMMEGTAGDVCRLVETGIADVGFIEHTAEIPDTLEISRTVADRGDLSWCAQADRARRSAINAEIPVTRVSCLAGIGGIGGIDGSNDSNDDVVTNSMIPEIADREIGPNNGEVAGTIRRLVAITRKAKRAA